jgi:hypothetical protein
MFPGYTTREQPQRFVHKWIEGQNDDRRRQWAVGFWGNDIP